MVREKEAAQTDRTYSRSRDPSLLRPEPSNHTETLSSTRSPAPLLCPRAAPVRYPLPSNKYPGQSEVVRFFTNRRECGHNSCTDTEIYTTNAAFHVQSFSFYIYKKSNYRTYRVFRLVSHIHPNVGQKKTFVNDGHKLLHMIIVMLLFISMTYS